MVNVLIIDKSINYCVKLLNSICNNNSSIRVTSIVNNVEDMYNLANHNSFDIILFDFDLLLKANTDSLLKIFIEKYKNSIIVLASKLDSISNFPEFNYSLKYDLDNLMKKILDVSYRKSEYKLVKNKINKELEFLGYNPNHLGTMYISEIIYIVYSTNFEGSLEKKIYPYIAEKHNKTVNSVKCNITNATTLMFFECPEQKLMNYLGKYTYWKPGPKTIIYTVINKISA